MPVFFELINCFRNLFGLSLISLKCLKVRFKLFFTSLMRRIELQNQMHTSLTLKSIKFGRFELYSAEGDYVVDFGSLRSCSPPEVRHLI